MHLIIAIIRVAAVFMVGALTLLLPFQPVERFVGRFITRQWILVYLAGAGFDELAISSLSTMRPEIDPFLRDLANPQSPLSEITTMIIDQLKGMK